MTWRTGKGEMDDEGKKKRKHWRERMIGGEKGGENRSKIAHKSFPSISKY